MGVDGPPQDTRTCTYYVEQDRETEYGSKSQRGMMQSKADVVYKYNYWIFFVQLQSNLFAIIYLGRVSVVRSLVFGRSKWIGRDFVSQQLDTDTSRWLDMCLRRAGIRMRKWNYICGLVDIDRKWGIPSGPSLYIPGIVGVFFVWSDDMVMTFRVHNGK